MKYFDNSATTPLDPVVIQTMEGVLRDQYANPSSPYACGRKARQIVEEARRDVAELLGAGELDPAGPSGVFFTASGTESNNMAIYGVLEKLQDRGRHLVTSAIEHPSVREVFARLATRGWEVDVLQPDARGQIPVESLEAVLRDDTVLVSVMMANNEVGTVQPIGEMAQRARRRGILFHTDAVQALGKIPIDVEALGVDLLSVSAHKVYGPKGVGALYVRKGTPLDPILHGGHQEHGLRPGTENVAGIAGFGTACRLAGEQMGEEAERKGRLGRLLEERLREGIPEVTINADGALRIPGHVSAVFRYVEAEALLTHLDLRGISASSGSACTTGSAEPSHVLLALGMDRLDAQSTLRFTIGRFNTREETEELAETLIAVVGRLREMSPLGKGAGSP